MTPARHILAALALLLAGPAAAGSGSALRPLDHRSDLLGWEAVGRLDVAGGGFCTATLIAPDLVLSAAHCVFDGGDAPVAPGRVAFRAGLAHGRAIAERRAVAIVVPDGYRPVDDGTIASAAEDVALLRLDRPIASAEADPFALHEGAPPGDKVSVASYGAGRERAISRQSACRIVARQGPVMAFDCDVTFGSSGAPVFARVGDRFRIVSVISKRAQTDKGPLAIGMSLDAPMAELRARLRASPAAPVETVARRITIGDDARASTGAKFVKP